MPTAPTVDVVDDTFLVVDRAELAREFADPRVWRRYWPDLELSVYADRGEAGLRWTVTGRWTGSMEVWLEPVLDGTVLHYYLRVDPASSTEALTSREATREGVRRQRSAKRIAFALKDRLERGRPPGHPSGASRPPEGSPGPA